MTTAVMSSENIEFDPGNFHFHLQSPFILISNRFTAKFMGKVGIRASTTFNIILFKAT